ncbi:MAG TPA: right-handed parallel beta-helix repeat-containing protein [Candidatus Aminicenantes bacterium]|nr:right-handed parallel beta-helix repeat-containing protein [Candidatus Aminicenantes bacterium]HRY65104.1 right-handed parallel beta-helix repeat-containing protein [Candidatus Aminicenantes bacterium]HRZ72017.1 right-handed parallel beta-helix repeat-containing protein [Candidatus Aminicenantes bacterium]
MKKLVLGLALAAGALVAYGTAGQAAAAVVDARTSAAIQQAVDRTAAAGGGTVFLPAGEYALRSAIRLRDNITLRGEGRATVLKRVPFVQVPLAADAGKGTREVRVKDTAGFEAGMEVLCWDTENFDAVTMDRSWALVKKVEKDRIILDRDLRQAYLVAKGAILTNAFYGVHGAGVSGARVVDLTIDGGFRDSERDFVFTEPGGYAGGGAYKTGHQQMGIQFTDCTDCQAVNCRVFHCGGNGISASGGENIRFIGCDSFANGWHGYHLGLSKQGATRCVMQNCRAHHNAMVGVYVCWNVLEGVFTGNHVTDNRGDGFLIGPYDERNVFSGNIISRNGGCGIIAVRRAFAGRSNTFVDNILCDNGVPGKTPAIWLQSPEDGTYEYYSFSKNLIIETRPVPAPGAPALRLDEKTDHITVSGNILQGPWAAGVENRSTGKSNSITD